MVPAYARIEALYQEGRTGVQIAEVLHAEGYSIRDALNELQRRGYVVAVEPHAADVEELHVSNQPMGAGFLTVIMAAEPRALPSVVWSNPEQSGE